MRKNAPLTVYHPTLTTVGSGLGGIRVHRPGSFGQFGYMEYGYGSGTTYIGSSYTGGTAADYGVIQFRQHSNGGTPLNSMQIDSSGNLLVGTTNTLPANNNVQGIALSAGSYGGRLEVSRSGGAPVSLNRVDSHGSIIELRKAGASVGTISTWGGNPAVGRLNCALLFNDDINRIIPSSVQSDITRDNVIDLGDPDHRFNDVWIGGGIHLSGTGSANKLDEYEEGNWAPSIGAGITAVGTVTTSGTYTKIGRIVTLHGKISATTSLTVGTTSVLCGELPFQIAGSHSFSFNLMNSAFDEIKPQGAWSLNLYATTAMAATTNLYFSVTYATA